LGSRGLCGLWNRAHGHVTATIAVERSRDGISHGLQMRRAFMGSMTPKIPSEYASVGMPTRAAEYAQNASHVVEGDREFAPREQALAFASALAERNAELTRRLA